MKTFAHFVGAAAFLALSLSPARAIELERRTELLLRCGAAFMHISQDEEMMSSKQEAELNYNHALNLLTKADAELAARNVSEADREALGRKIGIEVTTALIRDEDPGFEGAECTALLLEDNPEAAAKVRAQTEEIDNLLTCTVLFKLVTGIAQDEADLGKADEYAKLTQRTWERAEVLMVEAGFDQTARDHNRQLYEQSILAAIEAGQDLSARIDRCAELED